MERAKTFAHKQDLRKVLLLALYSKTSCGHSVIIQTGGAGELGISTISGIDFFFTV